MSHTKFIKERAAGILKPREIFLPPTDVTVSARTSAKQLVVMPGKETLDTGVRVYGESPDRSALQIRSHGPIIPGGVKRHMYSHASLDIQQIEELIVLLEAQRTRLVSHL